MNKEHLTSIHFFVSHKKTGLVLEECNKKSKNMDET